MKILFFTRSGGRSCDSIGTHAPPSVPCHCQTTCGLWQQLGVVCPRRTRGVPSCLEAFSKPSCTMDSSFPGIPNKFTAVAIFPFQNLNLTCQKRAFFWASVAFSSTIYLIVKVKIKLCVLAYSITCKST